MEKYITDAIHNSLRTVTAGMTRPRQKAIAEVVRGLFTKGEPILTHLAQNPGMTAKKQAEKCSYHLGNVDLTEVVEALALRKVASTMRKNTVIAYDCTDINKDEAEEMEGLSGIWVLDRGNDSGAFYRDLRHSLNVRFIARTKENRTVILVKTGEYISIKDVPEGRHAVHRLRVNQVPQAL